MERKLVVLLVMGLLAIAFGQTAFIYYTSLSLVVDSPVTAQATTDEGFISICVNTLPTIGFECNTSLRQEVFYSCALNYSDPDNTTLAFSFITHEGYMGGTVDSNGIFAVIPYQNMTGISKVEFFINDGSSCMNNQSSVNVTFNVSDRNDAPIYDVPIVVDGYEEIGWFQGTSFRGLYLTDHFSDPDGDSLTYQYFSFSSEFTFSILGTSEIILNHNSCGEGSVIFQAKDPYNLTASSGVISLDVTCEEDNAASGGGGGGGSFSDCETEWKCGGWDRCLINNTQRKTCTDIHGCADPYTRDFWQECTYIAHCYNGIRDLDEEDLDCGGDDCAICETCHDFKLNNYEVETDCGGPNCNACANCEDGLQNYQETGLDCGGPSCEPCPTCRDGIQNQNETGLDCGGPYCSPCTRIEAPTLIDGKGDQEKLNIVLLGSFLGLAVLAVTYSLFKNQIHTLLAAILLSLAMKKQKQILLSNDQKKFILTRLADIEKKHLLESKKLIQFQDLLSRLQRQFFSFLIDSAADTPLIHERIDKLHANKKVKELLKRQYVSLIKLETKKEFSKLDLMLSLEFFRTMVLHTSKVSKVEVSRTVSELTENKKPSVELVSQMLYNGILALQFSKNAVARDKYMKALELYQTLSPKVQAKIYDELVLDFQHLAYASTFQ